MPQEKAEVAERVMDAFNRRDVDAFIQPTTADFEWFPALGMAVEGGSFRGREGVETYFEALHATWEEVRLVAENVRDLGQTVLWLGRIDGRGRGSGVPVDSSMGAVFDFRGGKVGVRGRISIRPRRCGRRASPSRRRRRTSTSFSDRG
jgi:ketosteroid isomerase-like protein